MSKPAASKVHTVALYWRLSQSYVADTSSVEFLR